MKKTLSLLFFALIGGGSFAQTLSIIEADSVVYGNASNSVDIFGYVTVKNVSNLDGNYLVKRIDANYNELTDSNAICWQTCFNPEVSVALFPLTIRAGQENREFVGHVYPDGDGVPRSGAITYVFYKQFDETDSIAFTMQFEVTTNFSLDETKLPEVTVFPNPASDRISVKLENINGEKTDFQLYNMVGGRIFTKTISSDEHFDIDLKKLSRGIYFYTLRQGNKALITKKLVVQ